MIQQSPTMQIIRLLVALLVCDYSQASCLPCSSHLCYRCLNTFPIDRTNVEKLEIICNSSRQQQVEGHERFYSIIQSYRTINCSMKTLYLDRYTLWNYLESMSVTHARLTRLSSVVFNRSLSISPILYSIKSLNVSHNSLRVLNKNFSYYFPSLEQLDLSYNQLTLIRKRTLSNFIHLKELYLNNNFLKHISPTMFPRQSLKAIALQMNPWHCSCANILTLSLSRPLPLCQTPSMYAHENISDIARQCLLYTKAKLLITVYNEREENFTCTLSPTIERWKNKTQENVTLISAWDLDQRRSISIDHLSNLSHTFERYLICFAMNSSYPESIETIFALRSSLNSTDLTSTNSTTVLIADLSIRNEPRLSPVLLWLFQMSKTILPRSFQNSNKHILIVWLALLTLALLIFMFLIYYLYHRRANKSSLELETDPLDHRTLFHVKFNCKNHKCLCQYRRRAHSTMHLTSSTSSTLCEKPSTCVRPSFIEPSQLRYAKIKRISSVQPSDQDYPVGEFRTLVKFQSLPKAFWP